MLRGEPTDDATGGPPEEADQDANPLEPDDRSEPRHVELTHDPVTQAFVAGHPDALRAVYDAHARLVFSFCRRALGPERAADATQEVFTSVWRQREAFDPSQGTLRGWVMGIARYKVLGQLRHEGARPSVPVAEAEPAPPPGGGDREIDLLADRLTLAQALRTLPERTRKVIQLSYVDGLSHREIADQLGLPLGSVKSDIRRGIERLRADLVVAS